MIMSKNTDDFIDNRLLARCLTQLRHRLPSKISKDIEISLLQFFFEKHKHGRVILSCTLSAAAQYYRAAVGIPLRTAPDAVIAACSSRTILLHTSMLDQQWAY
jgi:hypothetical protein